MELKINDKLHGFTVTDIRDVEEFEGRLVEMTHDRTGAGLIWADSGDENKLFSVGFKTLPEDSTGVFHILEHSVLCGSAKYPVKEPFVELLKTSMNTFLNAMTYQDKTLYPVSSRMEQDYLNLMGVYLDAVFAPAILTNPDIFYQEGWHIDTDRDEPYYKGVVFNEMKGAMSDVDQVAERTMLGLLFPDNCYGFNSGGDPEVIPDLTYGQFIETYKRYYHPSNAYFYLDGDIPLEKTLEVIDGYIGSSERLEDIPVIEMQTPVTSDRVCVYDAEEGSKSLVVYGRIIGTWEDRDKLLALNALTEQLADSNESPLKRAVLSSGLAEDMELYISDGIAQPYLMIIFRGVDPDNAEADGDKLMDIVRETVAGIAASGIPERDLTASVNQMDFRFRQYPEPQGLYRANVVYNSWLYGGDPLLYLRTNEAVASLRELIAGNRIPDSGSPASSLQADASSDNNAASGASDDTSMIDAACLGTEYFTDTDKFCKLTLIPSATYGDEKAAKEQSRVAAAVAAMTDEERAALDGLNASLVDWQNTPDPNEAIASIPQLDLKDISRVPELIGTEVSEKDGVTLLYHPVTTNGIVHINAFFPVTDLTAGELPAAALVKEFFRDLPTENYDVIALQNEIKMYIGSLSFDMAILARDDDPAACTPCLRVRASVLKDNLDHAIDLIVEILTRTKFEDTALMKEIITQLDDECKRDAVSSGHRLALSAARSHYSARDAATEAANGYTFTQYMHVFTADFDEEIGKFCDFARGLMARSIVRSGAVISVTASEPADVTRLIDMLPEGQARPKAAAYESSLPVRMGIAIPASVSFAVQAYDLSLDGIRASGSISVAANIISLAHLWNEIRVKGGSYGTSISATRTGSVFCYTYRDPDPARSLATYKTIPGFLEGFAGTPDIDFDGFIISTIAGTEPLVSPSAKGRLADDFWFSGVTDEDRIRIREEILDTNADDLLSWKAPLAKLTDDGCICVVGPRAALEKCEGLTIVSI